MGQLVSRAAAGHEVVDAETDAVRFIGQARDRTAMRRERAHRMPAPDCPYRPDLVLVAEGRRLVRLPPKQPGPWRGGERRSR